MCLAVLQGMSAPGKGKELASDATDLAAERKKRNEYMGKCDWHAQILPRFAASGAYARPIAASSVAEVSSRRTKTGVMCCSPESDPAL